MMISQNQGAFSNPHVGVRFHQEFSSTLPLACPLTKNKVTQMEASCQALEITIRKAAHCTLLATKHKRHTCQKSPAPLYALFKTIAICVFTRLRSCPVSPQIRHTCAQTFFNAQNIVHPLAGPRRHRHLRRNHSLIPQYYVRAKKRLRVTHSSGFARRTEPPAAKHSSC